MRSRVRSSPSNAAHAVASAARGHDAALRTRRLGIWVGAEPTFTDRLSLLPEWQTDALGPDKLERARRFAARLASHQPSSVLLRTVGRQYGGEATPRWNFGVYALRRGHADWTLPPDPTQTQPGARRPAWRPFARVLARELRRAGFATRIQETAATLPTRILFAREARTLRRCSVRDLRLRRPLLDSLPVPASGAQDALLADGLQLVALGACASGHAGDIGAVQVELPAFSEVASFISFLQCTSRAARQARVSSLVFSGYPPPVDATVAWTTVTPDPGVLEVNMAPCRDAASFLREQRRLHAVAAEVGLSGTNLLFNGEVTDSGGGQHLTFGGSTPQRSPFFEHPRLLPRLIAYLNRHPSLSYWFAGQSVGSSSQQPRPDEVSPESFEGLCVAADLLHARRTATPEELWSSVAPFLTDRFGNTHRAEINVEKLWNPYTPGRGRLGLVELRAFGMTRTPEDAAAVALLARSLLALLTSHAEMPPLRHWGQELHDRFALPFYLQRDLEAVLQDLDRGGLGLPLEIRRRLLDDARRRMGTAEFGDVRLWVRRAERFWPLTGSLSAPEEASRWVDSSTQRFELLLLAPRRMARELARWRLIVEGMEVPWVLEQDRLHAYALRGIRCKTFHPQLPLLPLVEVREPLCFMLQPPGSSAGWEVRCHHWRPHGGKYAGLPRDEVEAEQRRQERFCVRPVRTPRRTFPPPASALAPFTLDLRRISRRS